MPLLIPPFYNIPYIIPPHNSPSSAIFPRTTTKTSSKPIPANLQNCLQTKFLLYNQTSVRIRIEIVRSFRLRFPKTHLMLLSTPFTTIHYYVSFLIFFFLSLWNDFRREKIVVIRPQTSSF